jgi:hypothetical protein
MSESDFAYSSVVLFNRMGFKKNAVLLNIGNGDNGIVRLKSM